MKVDLQRKPLIIAHRGERILAPENTIKACHLALEQGATALEIDVRVCGTGELIVFHDNFLLKHFGKAKTVALTSLAEIKSLEFLKKNYKYPAQICTLDEFFEEFRGKVPINIDAKNLFRSNKELARLLIQLIEDFNIEDQIWISSFNPLLLHFIKKMRPSMRTGYLFSNFSNMHKLIDRLIENDAWHPHYRLISERLVKMARDLQKELYVWTINDEPLLNLALAYGLDGIITDTFYRTR
ncbi:MAG: hypothetical protein GF313_06605 [Caldithrix sp.]|nr:hypothetical protein [Caldithrix sp.]